MTISRVFVFARVLRFLIFMITHFFFSSLVIHDGGLLNLAEIYLYYIPSQISI